MKGKARRTMMSLIIGLFSGGFNKKHKDDSFIPQKTHQSRVNFGRVRRNIKAEISGKGCYGKQSGKLSRKLQWTITEYRSRRLRQFANQGLSRAERNERIEKDKYLKFCMNM